MESPIATSLHLFAGEASATVVRADVSPWSAGSPDSIPPPAAKSRIACWGPGERVPRSCSSFRGVGTGNSPLCVGPLRPNGQASV